MIGTSYSVPTSGYYTPLYSNLDPNGGYDTGRYQNWRDTVAPVQVPLPSIATQSISPFTYTPSSAGTTGYFQNNFSQLSDNPIYQRGLQFADRAIAGGKRLGEGINTGLQNLGNTIGETQLQHNQLSTTDRLMNYGNMLQAGVGLWNAWQNSKFTKQALNHQRDVFNKNYELNRKQVNSQLEDRQRARVASNPYAYQSVDSYMNKYGVK